MNKYLNMAKIPPTSLAGISKSGLFPIELSQIGISFVYISFKVRYCPFYGLREVAAISLA
jgi:hypothetical protein